jgi:lipopolysaccharide export system ATP-binding protein|tara:strand:- start:24 stop:800 length:777 start_codon:yes stop_codon:yes gene_type:complete
MAIIKKFRIKSFKKQKPLVQLKNISLSFGKRKILDNVSFNINQGEILGMLGPNGVGKSTIFNLITGLIKPDYGSIFFDSINATNYPIYVRTIKFKIGYVPQHGGYFKDLTLLENLKAIGEILIDDEKERISKINVLISKFELDSVINIKAKFLSGGQKKKLVIALALLGDPKVLLLDECFAALDVLTIKMLQQIIVSLQTENNIGICICDHQARDLLSCVDLAIVLSNCKIIAKGAPAELIKDPNAKSAYFGESFKFN